jgi:hypothetical protein
MPESNDSFPYPELIKFVKEARKRGYDDSQIKEALLKNDWQLDIINAGFAIAKINKDSGPKYTVKNQVMIYLDSEVLKALDKRAKKNMFSLNEQIEDILRRSCIMGKKIKQQEDELDDMFVKLFSRKDVGRPRKE